MVPKIVAKSIEANREFRRQQLIDAALGLAVDGQTITVSAVAKRAKLSRAAIYEYFSSSADLITDLVVEEMEIHCNRLTDAISQSELPLEQIELWIAAALEYVADGRHMLMKSFSATTTPDFRKEDVALGHKKLMMTLLAPIQQMSFKDPYAVATYVQTIVDAAAKRIDAGKDKELEVQQATRFVLAGLQALKED